MLYRELILAIDAADDEAEVGDGVQVQIQIIIGDNVDMGLLKVPLDKIAIIQAVPGEALKVPLERSLKLRPCRERP